MDTGEIDLERFGLFQCRIRVEQVRYERQIQLIVASDNVGRRHETPAADFVGLLQHSLGTHGEIANLQYKSVLLLYNNEIMHVDHL